MSNMAKRLARSLSLLTLLVAPSIAGIAQESGSPVPPVASPIRISAGDLIELTMFENADLSGRFRVDEKGSVLIPLIGTVYVEGKTAEEAAKTIENRFVEDQILQPAESQATVYISEYATQGITVNGEVKLPGVYPALGVRMLNDVVSAAGGVLPTASSKVIITHQGNIGNSITVDYNPSALKPVIPNIQILPGDTILIPRAGIVYVVGNVNRAGAYVLDGRQTLTVEEIMGLAGGSGRAAAIKRVQLVRSIDGGGKEMIIIPVNLIYKGKAPDVALRDGDILYVPTSTAKLVAEQVITSAISVSSSIAVYKTSTNP
jgi:polysaccharide biosynthesis/export protein